MKKIATKVVKSFDGHQVEFSIGHQSFRLEEQLEECDMTSYQVANWYKKQLDQAFSGLLQSENPEVVSDAPSDSGVYTQVRERDESGQDSNSSKASVTVPLGNMIDSENITYSRAGLIEVLKIAQSCAKMENGFAAEDIANAEFRADDLFRNLKFE